MDGETRDYYVRQLHDWKGAVEIENLRLGGATLYARLCGSTLARAHARACDRVAVAAYLGKGDAFDRAVADFARAYADQNERDYETFMKAIASGRLEAASRAVSRRPWAGRAGVAEVRRGGAALLCTSRASGRTSPPRRAWAASPARRRWRSR